LELHYFCHPLSHAYVRTYRFEHDYEKKYYEHNRVDAVAMERLTPSPYVMDIYSYCGNSVITEFATQSFNNYIKQSNPFERLLLARDIARGMADIHGIDAGGNVTLVHNDINPANVMIRDKKPRFNDFNVAILMTWNKEENRPCQFQGDFSNAQVSDRYRRAVFERSHLVSLRVF